MIEPLFPTDEIRAKTCTKCKIEKSLDGFGKDKSRKDGLTDRCKECRKANNATWRATNPEKVKAGNAAYRAANPEKKKASAGVWRAENPEKKKANDAAYRAANPEKRRTQSAAWVKANPEKAKAHAANRRARKLAAEGSFSPEDIDFIRDCQNGKCAYCAADLSETGEHIDHVIPLSRGGSNWPINLQLTCPPCNFKKRAKHPVDFEREMIAAEVVSWPGSEHCVTPQYKKAA